jgi:hypothetical protein
MELSSKLITKLSMNYLLNFIKLSTKISMNNLWNVIKLTTIFHFHDDFRSFKKLQLEQLIQL